MGPSGAGKTIFLNVAAGRIDGGEMSGDVYLDNLPVYATRRGRAQAHQMTGLVTQFGTPWEDMLTFRENLQCQACMHASTVTSMHVRARSCAFLAPATATRRSESRP